MPSVLVASPPGGALALALALAGTGLIVGLAALLLLVRARRRARERTLWQQVQAALAQRGLDLIDRAERAELDLGEVQLLDPAREPFLEHVRAGATQVVIAVGEEYERLKRRPPARHRAHAGTQDLIGFARKADHASIAAERRRILEEELPRIQRERSAIYARCEHPCSHCGGEGTIRARAADGARDGRTTCATCAGVGKVINTAALDNLPKLPAVPLPVDEVRVIFLYPAR